MVSCLTTIQSLTLTSLSILDDHIIGEMIKHLVLLRALILYNVSSSESGVSRVLGQLVESCLRIRAAIRAGEHQIIACPELRVITSHGSNGITEKFLAGLRGYLGLSIEIVIVQRRGFHIKVT